MRRRTNYLNNRDLLIEINKSKMSFCELVDEKFFQYDIIIENHEDIFKKETIEQAKINKAARLSSLGYANYIENLVGKKTKKVVDFKIEPDSIADDEVVIRHLTFEHIPLSDRKKNPRNEGERHVKLNFTPYKHYAMVDGKIQEVGVSHTKDGEFALGTGEITPKLAKMMMLLVQRYSQRSNWRGYCVDTETEALTQRGWLNWKQIKDDDVILSYDNGEMKWSDIDFIFADHYEGNMFHLESTGIDALVTPGHKFLTNNGLKKVEHLLETDKIILMGDALQTNVEATYDDHLVELIGWTTTEGCIDYEKGALHIYQNEGKYAERIRDCLDNLGFEYSESVKEDENCIRFLVYKKYAKQILDLLDDKNITMNFILSLTTEQRELLINTMVDGDGWRRGDDKQYQSYCQKDKEHVDLYQALCAISGKKTNSHLREVESYGKDTSIYNIHTFSKKVALTENVDMHGGKSGRGIIGKGKAYNPNKPTVPYDDTVWCPKTEYGCFVARRNGKVYLTGNTYVDEMVGQSLLQLVQMCLQFDEHKSDNPFSYYTASISNSFKRVLNGEKQNQNIRDDLLEEAGQTPSFTRQLAHDEVMRSNYE